MRRPLLPILILAALFGGGASAAGGDGLVLERIVVVQRHGVRSPTKSVEDLSRYSAERWPDWPVGEGELTDHGREDVRLMGAFIRADYARRGLWPAQGCLGPNAAYVWADGQDQRTRLSGQALLDGAFPACGLVARHGPDDQPDGRFSAASSGLCPVDADRARRAVMDAAGGDLDHADPRYAPAKAALKAILGGPKADVLDASNALKGAAKGGVQIDGPLATASTLTESLYLEYAQGMPPASVGWGRAGSAAAIAAVMPLHDIDTDLLRRTPYLAEHNGALVARAVLAGLQGQPALPEQNGAGAQFLAIAGHDTQLSNLAGVLDVDWTLKDQPDKTPPAAALVFELWKSAATGGRFVRVALLYPTLEDLRAARPLTAAHPAGRVDLAIPGCSDGPQGACRLETFVARIQTRLPADCPLRP